MPFIEQYRVYRTANTRPEFSICSVEDYVKTNNIKAIVMPTYYPKDAAEKLSRRVGAKVITICQNVGEMSGTDDVFSFFDYNFKQISDALK